MGKQFDKQKVFQFLILKPLIFRIYFWKAVFSEQQMAFAN